MGHPHGQEPVRSTLRASAFCAAVRPVKSTEGSSPDVFQSWAKSTAVARRQSAVPLADENAMCSLYPRVPGPFGRRGTYRAPQIRLTVDVAQALMPAASALMPTC